MTARAASGAASGRGEPARWRRSRRPTRPATRAGNAGDRLVLATGAVAVAGLVATVVVSLGGGFSEPTLSARLDTIRRDATLDRRSTEMTRTADFHGTGDKSYLFLFSDKQSLPEPGRAPRPRTSDELRIYDRSGNGLKLRFSFQPDRPGLVYQHRFLGDIDGDGEEELVGGWGVPGEASQALLPFMVDWDEGANRYRLTSLQPAPALPIATPSALGVPFVETYKRRLDLRDGKQTLSGYRVQDFAIVKPSRLVTGVVVKPMTPTLTGTVELKPSILRLAGAGPELIECHVQGVDAPARAVAPRAAAGERDLRPLARGLKSRPCVPKGDSPLYVLASALAYPCSARRARLLASAGAGAARAARRAVAVRADRALGRGRRDRRRRAARGGARTRTVRRCSTACRRRAATPWSAAAGSAGSATGSARASSGCRRGRRGRSRCPTRSSPTTTTCCASTPRGSWWFEALRGRAGAAGARARAARGRARAGRARACRRSRCARRARRAHVAAVRECVERIAAGEIFQANLCLRLETAWDGDVAQLFAQAAPRCEPAYGACFLTPWGGIASLSPELFLRRARARRRDTGPIKGTTPRDGDPRGAARARRRTAPST